jgi:hypothetical protein
VETERLFKIDRVACPEAGRNIDDIQDTRTAEEADFRREEGGNAETYDRSAERFFGDLCLFADDIDAPESDD